MELENKFPMDIGGEEDSKADKFFTSWLEKKAGVLPATIRKNKKLKKLAGGAFANAPVNPYPEPIPSSAISYQQDVDKFPYPIADTKDTIQLRGVPDKNSGRVNLKALRETVGRISQANKKLLENKAKEPALKEPIKPNTDRPESLPENLGRPSEVELPEGWGVIPTIRLPFFSGHFSPRGDATLEKGAVVQSTNNVDNVDPEIPPVEKRIKSLNKADKERRLGRKIVRIIGLPFLFKGESSSALKRMVGLGLSSTKRDIEETVKKQAGKNNLFSNSEAHPIALITALEKKYGPEWKDWEPETLEETLAYGGYEVRPINFEKIMSARAVLKDTEFSKPFYDEPNVFEKVVLAFNGTHPMFSVVQEMPLAQAAFAISSTENYLRQNPFNEKIAIYLAGRCLDQGFIIPPLSLSFCEPYLDEHIDQDLKKASLDKFLKVLNSDEPFNPSEEDPIDVQVGKQLKIAGYLMEQHTKLVEQLPDLIEG